MKTTLNIFFLILFIILSTKTVQATHFIYVKVNDVYSQEDMSNKDVVIWAKYSNHQKWVYLGKYFKKQRRGSSGSGFEIVYYNPDNYPTQQYKVLPDPETGGGAIDIKLQAPGYEEKVIKNIKSGENSIFYMTPKENRRSRSKNVESSLEQWSSIKNFQFAFIPGDSRWKKIDWPNGNTAAVLQPQFKSPNQFDFTLSVGIYNDGGIGYCFKKGKELLLLGANKTPIVPIGKLYKFECNDIQLNLTIDELKWSEYGNNPGFVGSCSGTVKMK